MLAACTAYFLRRRGAEVIVVERNEVAGAASGKAGGFLALDWCAGSALDALARRSFALHAHLATEVEGDWGYRRMNAYTGFIFPDRAPERRAPARLDWLSDRVALADRIGTPETTAIVHPAKFTRAMMEAARLLGADVRRGRVSGVIRRQGEPAVAGVEIDGSEKLEADAVVIALGPWSLLAAAWLRLPPVFGQLSPSVVYDTGTAIPADALFLEYRERRAAALTVEVFPRADGSTHVTAFSSAPALPADPADVTPDPEAIERLEAICRVLSPAFHRARIIARQACFRPVTQDGLPLVGSVPHTPGAYVSTGHNVWGILNAPATGEALAELIVDGVARGTDLTPFDPGRLRPLDFSSGSTGSPW